MTDQIRAAASKWLRDNEARALELIEAYKKTDYTLYEVFYEGTPWTKKQINNMASYITTLWNET